VLRETRRAVGYPHRWLLNGSPFSVARTIVFYWHSTWRRDNHCCSLSTVCVRHFINFVLLCLNVFCEDVGAADFVYSERNFAGSEQWEPAYIPTWCYICEYIDLELMFALPRVLRNTERVSVAVPFYACILEVSVWNLSRNAAYPSAEFCVVLPPPLK
jgi:hypothetical protein